MSEAEARIHRDNNPNHVVVEAGFIPEEKKDA